MGSGEWIAVATVTFMLGCLVGVYYTAHISDGIIDRIDRGYAALIQGQAQAYRELLEAHNEGREG